AAVPEVIADRIDSGGLPTRDPARIRAHRRPWTPTPFCVGRAPLPAPTRARPPPPPPPAHPGGAGRAHTGLVALRGRVPRGATARGPGRGGPGAAPADRWLRVIDLAGTIPGLNAGPPDAFPVPIARLHAWADANVLLSGPIADRRVGLLVTTTATRSSRFE